MAERSTGEAIQKGTVRQEGTYAAEITRIRCHDQSHIVQPDQSCSLKFLILTVDVGRKRADETLSVLYVTRASDAPRLECSLCFG
jgi:hypothetical protein